ncbi:MAG: rhodanese-like domain-containing protein [Helicobacteraceae bacterium]|jgi:rhodanese-related sulfurtransferase|nr:rhodanese-like domain-containing protein [Helicobacteraceae bacterium]
MIRILLLMLLALIVQAADYSVLQYTGVDTVHEDGKKYHLQRNVPKECFELKVNNATVWEGNYAAASVPEQCKGTFVETVGKLSPMHMAEGIESYGELEVLAFIKEKATNKELILVDSRGSDWYAYETIPGAVNYWFTMVQNPKKYPDEFGFMLEDLNVVTNKDGSYDFSKAKTMLLFCNGPWCGQSPAAIRGYLAIGYPVEKMKWYRGGMHVWKSLSMTTTLTKQKK